MASKISAKKPAKVLRYDIHLVGLDPTSGKETRKTRPCVVVSPDAMHPSGMAVVCPLTTSLHPTWAHRLQISCDGKDAEIMVDQIRAVSLSRFIKPIDRLNSDDAESLCNVISLLYSSI